MIYKRFTFLVVLRIALLLTTVVVIGFIFGDQRLFFNQIILGLVLIIQVWELVRFVNHTNRELAKFFYTIRHSDFSITLKHSILGKSFKELHTNMAEIVLAFKQVKIEKEAQFHFLQMLVNQLHIGIIAIEKHDQIMLINPTAEYLVGMKGLKNWKLLETHNPKFTEEIAHLGQNGKKLLELKNGNNARFLSVDVRTLIIPGKPLKLITVQDIDSEIEQKEIEAWHKLIRILTHEIMNSVTPISSLTETMQSMLQDKAGNETPLSALRQETISDMRFSLNTIQKRSNGLLHFVENYRKLTKIPKPVMEDVSIQFFLTSIEKLMITELNRKNISFHVSSEDAAFRADPILIEQVLINLIANSIHAVANVADPRIEVKGYSNEHNAIIEVTDNGKGIHPKELSEIFIPFFTTKKEGSGIGLSLSKQIMSLHGGSVKVQSELNAGTSFFLHFPAKQ